MICLDALIEDTGKLPCGHQFHLQCMASLTAKGYNHCPICRRSGITGSPIKPGVSSAPVCIHVSFSWFIVFYAFYGLLLLQEPSSVLLLLTNHIFAKQIDCFMKNFSSIDGLLSNCGVLYTVYMQFTEVYTNHSDVNKRLIFGPALCITFSIKAQKRF